MTPFSACAVELRAKSNEVTEDSLKTKSDFYAEQKQLDESKKQSKTLDKIAESTEIMVSKESVGDDFIMR